MYYRVIQTAGKLCGSHFLVTRSGRVWGTPHKDGRVTVKVSTLKKERMGRDALLVVDGTVIEQAHATEHELTFRI